MLVYALKMFSLNSYIPHLPWSEVSNLILGNILMLSEGVHGVDNVFSLKDGMDNLSSPNHVEV